MAHRQVVGRDLVGRLAGRRRLGEEPPRERYGFRRPAGIDQSIDGGRSGQVAGMAPARILQSRGRALAHRYRALEGTGTAQVLEQGLHRVCLVDHRLHANRAARRGSRAPLQRRQEVGQLLKREDGGDLWVRDSAGRRETS